MAIVLLAIVPATRVLRPPPATTRLAGVSAAVTSYTIEDLAERRHRLRLTVTIASPRDVGECLAFALDEPFAGAVSTPRPAPASSHAADG